MMSRLVTTVAVAVSSVALVATTASTAGGTVRDRPAVASRASTDGVPTPTLDWYPCLGKAECATSRVPLDYDDPDGAQVELALLRLKATDPRRRIGSLFLNPGGPGSSATELAYFSDAVLSPSVRSRFDVVGMDPRGVGFSDNVTCFAGPHEQAVGTAGYDRFFPTTAGSQRRWLRSDRALGGACSRDSLATSMSTAEVARDMELMRRAVGDRKLTYLGFSYGTYLGQVYAAMFPHRFRAVAVDGVIDPVAWAGSPANQDRPLADRLGSARGSWQALREILVRCDRVGGAQCTFAPGDPVANLALIAERLKTHPYTEVDPFSGQTFTFGYADLVATLSAMLYDPAGYLGVVDMLTQLMVLTEPPADRKAAGRGRTSAALRAFALVRRKHPAGAHPPRFDFPYANERDAYAAVTCTDSREATSGRDYPAYAAAADRSAPYFGRLWTWQTSVCAGDSFTGEDEDGYRGPFTRATTAPVLFVGTVHDPATIYQGAVSASRRLPNSRLLSSNSFGHTAYGTSDCVTSAVDRYLLRVVLPPRGRTCTGDVQPFDSSTGELASNEARERALRRSLGARGARAFAERSTTSPRG
ncbi:MAG: alpha/beta hydrolase [Nocardioidaceae bacterium]